MIRTCCLAFLLHSAPAIVAQIDTLAVIDETQRWMDQVDDLRARGPVAIWVKVPGQTAPVQLQADRPDPEQMDLIHLLYGPPQGAITGIGTIRFVGPDSILDASVHYFDGQGRTLAVRWELSMPGTSCHTEEVIDTEEVYLGPQGQVLEQWNWLTDPSGQELDPNTCRITRPPGRTARYPDRGSLLQAAGIPNP